MNKFLKLTALIASTIIIITSLFCIQVAAANSSIAVNQKSSKVGDTVIFTVTINGGEAMYATEADFTYDPAVLKFNSGDSSSGGNGSVHIVGTPGGNTKQSYSLYFTALAEGSCTVSMTNVKYVGNDEVSVNGASVPGISVKAAQQAPSNNANLSSLTVSAGSLSPKFSANTTNYTVTVDNNVEKLTVNAKANGEATVAGTGNIALKVGSNKHTVTVTAPDGTKKTYSITVTRRDENDTSSEDETDEDETTDEPAPDVLAVHIAGKPYHVLSELPETPVAPMGFETSTAEYNGAPVAVYASAEKEYVLYILKNDESGALDFYTYDSLRDDFLLLPYANFNDKMYILAAPSETAFAPEGYIDTELNIGNSSIRAFAALDDGMRDFYMIRCFADGEFKYYSYDSSEKTLQRAPDFKPIEREQLDIDTTPDNSDKNLLEWFKGIPVTGKTVIFAVAIIAICAIAIIVLLIIRAAKRPQFSDGDGILFEPEDEFDEIKGATFPFKLEDEETAPEIQEKAEDVE